MFKFHDCLVETNANFLIKHFFYMFCAQKVFLGTIKLPDASVLLDLLPHTPTFEQPGPGSHAHAITSNVPQQS